MNQTKRILSSLKLTNSIYSTRFITTHSLSHQVTHLSPSISSLFARFHAPICVFSHQNLFFSSKPEPILKLVVSEDWSKELEQELFDSKPELTHGNVIYVLKRLDKDPFKAFKFFIWVVDENGFEPSSAMYSLLLQILASNKLMKEFWIVVTKMKEHGFFIDGDTYKTILLGFKNEKMSNEASAFTHFYNRMVQDNAADSVVKEFVDVVMGSEWSDEVEKRLLDVKISVSDNFVVGVLKELRQSPLKAVRVFKWLNEGCGWKHNAVTYNAIVRVLGRYDSIHEFWIMVKEMKSEGHDIDIDTYVKISRRFQKIKMLEDAVKLYEHMMDGPYKPSMNDCSLLLRSISANSNPDMELVFRVAKKYEEAGHTLSKSFYDGIHRSLTSVGRFEEAEEIMEAMRKGGHEPDNITYSQLIYGLGKAGRLEEACEVIDIMEANGCVPDLKTWTILIQGHCAAGAVDKALFFFAKMMENDFDADADLLDILVKGFLKQNKTSGAYKLLVELVKNVRLKPWQATFKNIIDTLLGERKVEEALDLLRLMKKHNYPPYPEPFNKYISKYGTVENALDFFKVLSSKDYPAVSAYQIMFQALFQEGRYSEAKDLLYKCPLHIRKHKAICSLFGSLETRTTASS
ncbi:pentatricopeptide repeat-containing protein At3g48250, chloroplastic [Apium graveolens]|uniref:pentatricopeptide repeat-containing protein At3g48250, chloroplastic n=1 Tax=Apium graveolens TaxID=4045 RepID=UPI003D79C530